MLLLEDFGGVYLDTDQHLVRPLPLDVQNVLAYQDPEHHLINGAAMVFERGNLYLRRVLEEAIRIVVHNYRSAIWGIVGPNLLTAIALKEGFVPEHLTILGMNSFYPYVYFRTHQCFGWKTFSSLS